MGEGNREEKNVHFQIYKNGSKSWHFVVQKKRKKNDYSVGGKSRKEVKVTGNFFFLFVSLFVFALSNFFTQEKIQIPVFNLSSGLSLTTFPKEKLFV